MDHIQMNTDKMNNLPGLEVSGFLKQISHELRTPMNTIVGSTELISREDISQRVRDSLVDIRQAADRLVLLTDDLIDIIRISSGELEIRNEEYCVEDFIVSLRSEIERRAVQKGLKSEINIDENIPYRMFGDSERVLQMLEKLVINAIEFTKAGTVRFDAKLLPGTDGNVFIRFDVTDNGSGVLDEGIVSVLSGREMNAEAGMRSVEGAALGVFLTKYIAGRMGGKLTAKARKDEGCTFTLLIRQGTVGAATLGDHISEESATEEISLPFTAEAARVLIVEDNLINARIEHAILHNYLINADITDNGADAVKLVRKIRYDMVLMDYMMPDMDGADTTRAIRALTGEDPERAAYYENLPIVAFTANTAKESMDELLAAGMNDFLSKPVDISELERVLREKLPAECICYACNPDGEGKSLSVLDSLGLNTRAALMNFSNDEEEYKNVLITTCRSSDTKGKMLSYYLEQHDYKNYIVVIHGILGVAQVIGADMIAAKCRELERAARQGLRDFIERETPIFSESFEKLLAAVRAVITTDEREDSKGAIDKGDLLSIIDELRGYLADYSINEVEDLFYKLAQFSYPDQTVMELIHTAEEQMLTYSYNEVIETLDKMKDRLRVG